MSLAAMARMQQQQQPQPQLLLLLMQHALEPYVRVGVGGLMLVVLMMMVNIISVHRIENFSTMTCTSREVSLSAPIRHVQ